jgi:YVTN family beta-propeller protein
MTNQFKFTRTNAKAFSVACSLSLFAAPSVYADNQSEHHRAPLPKIVANVPGELHPAGIAINEKTNIVYVTNMFEKTMSVMDGKTDKIVTTIPVGSIPVFPAVDEKTNIVYVPNSEDGTVSVVEGKTNMVVNTIPVGSDFPQVIALNHETHKLYVAMYFNEVLVLDEKTNNVIGKIPQEQGGFLALNEKTNKIYLPNYFDGTVSVFDGKTNQLIKTITVGSFAIPDNCYLTSTCINQGSGAAGLSVNEETNKIYVNNVNDGTIVTIDGKSDEVVKTLSIGAGLWNSAIDEKTNTIYSINYVASTLSVVDGKTNKLIDTISMGSGFVPSNCYLNQSTCMSVGSFPQGVAVNAKTGKIYVANTGDMNGQGGSIVVLDSKTHRKIAEEHMGPGGNNHN